MKKFALMTAFVMAGSGSAGAATLINGSFEAPGTYDGSFQTVWAGSTALEGWTIESGSVDLIGSYWQHSDGDYSLDMNGSALGVISQRIADLVVGAYYALSFDMAGNTYYGGTTMSVTASVDGAGGGVFEFDTTGQSQSDMGWLTQSFQFQATDTSAVLQFASNETGVVGPALDNVRIEEVVAPVPVPAAGGLLLAGLGLLGFARRRLS
ncbi:choice-of-anchor C family protein (plasmid) [Pseudorhodobacter turbinis]|uniref:Choice-of-anchor C family protein n=1 Tax=Pseudorhodobacter turbinis TaxID=2500533 RepID=A0A4V1E138_9RHOB|nr:choice-of-anchor C family protein [Pseudorhodobacter turbinis]QCO56784.1 choice-of-anchor C family protein [Pseudorhodobacter turbinis]